MIKDLARSGVNSTVAFRQIADEYPERWIQSAKGIRDLFFQLAPPETFGDEAELALWSWQEEAFKYITSEECLNSDREVLVFEDSVGGAGKTRLSKKLINHFGGRVSFFTPCAKGDDLACGLRDDSLCCIADIPFNTAPEQGKLLYEFMEKVRGRVVFSGKYNAHTVFLPKMPCVIFTNAAPVQMSRGRILLGRLVWPQALSAGSSSGLLHDPARITIKWYRDGEWQRGFTPTTQSADCLVPPDYLSQHRILSAAGGMTEEPAAVPVLRVEEPVLTALRAAGAQIFPGVKRWG